MDCEYEHICQNNTKCFRCFNQNLLKTNKKPWQKKEASRKFIDSSDTKSKNSKNSWEDLEQEVADSLNNVPTIQQARRSIRSGALWFETGDIVDEILHPECKERTGRQLKSGDQSISIQKHWLEKASDECKSTKKVMCLPFRFKGDNKIYTIFEHNDIAELITLMRAYIKDNELKTEQIKILEEKLNVKSKEAN
jgi:hypothetical protein